MQHNFNWLSLIPGFDYEQYGHVLMLVVVMVVILGTTLIARLQLNAAMKREDEGLIPDSKMTFRNFFDIAAEQIYDLCEGVLGEEGARLYFPIIGTLFILILICNLIGIIPGILPPTENLNTTLAFGIFVFLYYNYLGFKEHGLGYFKHFMGPVVWLAPLIFVIEMISNFIRPISLGFRLRGNIMGDHLVVGVFSHLVPLVVPIIFLGMGLFVAFIQAFVFCLLTMIYISLSTSHEH